VPYETKGKYQRVSKQKSDKDVISSESDSRLTAYHPHTYPHTHTHVSSPCLCSRSLAPSVAESIIVHCSQRAMTARRHRRIVTSWRLRRTTRPDPTRLQPLYAVSPAVKFDVVVHRLQQVTTNHRFRIFSCLKSFNWLAFERNDPIRFAETDGWYVSLVYHT